jgi:hypothetical protein
MCLHYYKTFFEYPSYLFCIEFGPGTHEKVVESQN